MYLSWQTAWTKSKCSKHFQISISCPSFLIKKKTTTTTTLKYLRVRSNLAQYFQGMTTYQRARWWETFTVKDVERCDSSKQSTCDYEEDCLKLSTGRKNKDNKNQPTNPPKKKTTETTHHYNHAYTHCWSDPDWPFWKRTHKRTQFGEVMQIHLHIRFSAFVWVQMREVVECQHAR